MDERRATVQGLAADLPAPPTRGGGGTHLSVRVFYCGVVLFHKDPLNKLNRLREDRDDKQVDTRSDQQGRNLAARQENTSLSVMH